MTVRKPVSRRTLKSDLTKVDAHVIRAHEYKDLPELTDESLARAVVNKGGRPRSRESPQTNFHPPSRRRHRALEGYWSGLANSHRRTS